MAVFVAEPAKLAPAEADAWCGDFDNWAICDTACFHLFDRAPWAWEKVHAWAPDGREYVRRAAFALVWSLSVHDKAAPDRRVEEALGLAERYADDDRPHVRKAIDMALRATGKRNLALHAAAVACAERLKAREEAAARWIGGHALRELRSASVTAQLGKRGSR